MDETESDDVVTVGQRLKEAREAKGLSIEDIAAQTRIPTRHLTSLESSDWDKLPAATYSVGFAKNYAGAVGLDRNEIGELLRAEMGGRLAAAVHPEVYEAVDPARTMPKGLVIGALLLLALALVALTWINNRSLEAEPPVAEADNVAAPVDNVAAPAPQPAAATGLVVLTATEPVWIEVKDGAVVLKQGQLAPGERYEVPANAAAPVLTTGKPEGLRITVGIQPAPAIGQPGTTVSGVSLKAADLLRPAAAQATTQPTQVTTQPPSARPAAQRPTRQQTRPASPPTQAPNPAPPSGANTVTPSGNVGDTAAQ